MTFSEQLSEKIVEGIYQGYMNYVEERYSHSKKMKISDAYTYMKGNHIESEIYNKTIELLEHKKETAGPSWKYLEFTSKTEETAKMFIVKNERYFDPDNVSKGKTINNETNSKSRQYLEEYMKSNVGFNIDDLYVIDNLNNQYALNFNDLVNERHKNQNSEKLFYIITYNIDDVTKMIDAIKIWLPLPEEDNAIMVQDLTSMLKDAQSYAGYEGIDEDRIKVLNSEIESEKVDASLFDITLDTKEEIQK